MWNDSFNNGTDYRDGEFDEHSQFKIGQSGQSKVEQRALLDTHGETKVIYSPLSYISWQIKITLTGLKGDH